MSTKRQHNAYSSSVFSHIRDRLASPLYLLTKTIKHQISCGPVDAVTLEAHYSLAEERLLRPQIEHNNVVSVAHYSLAEERLLRPQIEHNSVVSVAHYSLAEERLLRPQIEHNSVVRK